MSVGHVRLEAHGLLVGVESFLVFAIVQEFVALLIVIVCVHPLTCGRRARATLRGRGSGNRTASNRAFDCGLTGAARHVADGRTHAAAVAREASRAALPESDARQTERQDSGCENNRRAAGVLLRHKSFTSGSNDRSGILRTCA